MCEMPQAWSESHPIARKKHRCYECHTVIAVGEQYWRFSGVYDEWCETFKLCLTCERLRDWAVSNNYDCVGFGELRDHCEDAPRNLLPGSWLMDIFDREMEQMPELPWEKEDAANRRYCRRLKPEYWHCDWAMASP